MMVRARRFAVIGAAASLLALPVAGTAGATTHQSSSLKAAATKHCKALLKKEGKTKFDAKYGKKNAMGKCVSAYEKAHKKKKKA